MNTHDKKTQDKKKKSFANKISQKRSYGKFSAKILDIRQGSDVQRKLRHSANNSHQANQLKTIQEMADDHLGTGPATKVAGEQFNDEVSLEGGADAIRAKAKQHKAVQRMAIRCGDSGQNAMPVQRVIQRGSKYDKLAKAANSDVDNGDYFFQSLNEADIKAATKEVLIEHLAGKKYIDLKGEELAAPNVILSKSWGGAEGVVLLPARQQSAQQIHTGEFVPNLMHEIGHMVKGQKDVPAMKNAIGAIAKMAREEAAKQIYEDANPSEDAWEEEVRADLTGLYLRKMAGATPTEDEYKALGWASDDADSEHPPGAYRIARISEYINQLK